MEYHEAADVLFGLRRFRPKPGTASTAQLLATLDDPHEDVAFVQVAGSNGKGSTARMVEQTLRETGLSVGLYTSPHLEDLRERVQVDGRKIPRSAVCAYVESVHDYLTEQAADGNSPTFFEAMTAMAIWQFGRENVDVAVLEVGIGGRYDATSVVDPVASAVTSVTLEHTGILGETEAEIARDKAHVAPADAPLVTGVTGPVLESIREVAGEVVTVGTRGGGQGADGDDETTAPDVRVEYGGRANHTEAAVSIDADDWSVSTQIPLPGTHQAENAGIAAALARQIADVSTDELARGLRNAHWPGRFEVLDTEPLVVLDGAHNPGACEQLAATLGTYEFDDLHLVFGAMHDKDHREMVAALPTPDAVITAEPGLDRAEDRDVLATVFDDAGTAQVKTTRSVPDALSQALADAGPDDCVLVTGSLFAVAEARSRWTTTGITKRIRDRSDARNALESAQVSDADVDRFDGEAVHRVVKTNLQSSQANRLRTELVRLGGECVVSGAEDGHEERVDAVLMGTLAQFEQLVSTLDREDGLETVAREIGETLGLESAATAAPESDTATATPTSAETPPWADRTAVMGILNVTPDSFHDGGEFDALEDAVERAEAMVAADVDVIDIGGESTRPGAEPVPVEEEIERVVPVIERIADLDVAISIDTRKAVVAEAALEAGADIINDVSGLEDPEMRFVAAEHDAGLIVMHSIDSIVDPDREVTYDDVVEDVIDQLSDRLLLAEKAGVDREQIVVDPGIGFGKSAAESFEILDRLEEFCALGYPVLVGHSHKSMFAHVGQGPDERRDATVAASALAADRGADLIRVHDVPENVAAVRTALAARDPERFDWES
ncbi:folylpolyglutamate synthase / 7,8-dihydropteroate reductase / dihydropteroate synthase [Natrialba magadii ATCC 43099]|uniref:Probable bifunctional folylpolyglutamate synthase/dihydropteroate synthase n=1 Tax=Natrialba magadii (strain ATCC 43099 / DSM 3394 / CCM 3739 / CIP 104546 / IAM 13178 / JCM 8861 / NBRC 102185 / NCIMB 2190 / MS3) TaxID=547559 RepID=D3SYE3_NATMM|nr:dihydropteroate synthase [Natrialba magadii]ADD06114.1 folylpolyglutamate synthase / 7,8-dihydropteroate reductase / dihydropteroate synthase [Natrialba magadii ATCC 43099]ELY30889.1 dihydropteroate synthase [Natrialba magadii ATCC 43099]